MINPDHSMTLAGLIACDKSHSSIAKGGLELLFLDRKGADPRRHGLVVVWDLLL
jgi:hypothetical protein